MKSPDNSTHHQLQAERQKDSVKQQIEAALRDMRNEIEANYRKGKKKIYPVRITRAEVLRRAGGIDRHTLSKPYHTELNAEVTKFLDDMTELLGPSGNGGSDTSEDQPSLEDFAQMLVAAQVTRDEALSKVDKLESTIRELTQKLSELEAENVRLRIADSNVLLFESSSKA